MEIIGSILLYSGSASLIVATIVWILKNPAKLPSKKIVAGLSIWLLLGVVMVIPLAWVYDTYFRPIHRYYRGDYDTLLVQAEFFSSGNCVISLMDRTDPKLTAYMHFGDYIRVGQRLKVSWNTMSRRSELELRGDSLHLPSGSYPRINRPLTLPADTINQPNPEEKGPVPISF